MFSQKNTKMYDNILHNLIITNLLYNSSAKNNSAAKKEGVNFGEKKY